jgi:hypothetical protein
MLYLPLPVSPNVVSAYCALYPDVSKICCINYYACSRTTENISATDWFFFMVLDIGTATIEAIPVGVRLLSGLMQATAVRAAGFGIVPLSSLAPAVK